MIDNDLQKIVPVEINKEMRKSFIEYAMSVIVSRALPDVRDGLKPVHRRIMYTMYEANLTPDKPYRKSATTVGDVLGKYHPHGDAAVYDAMVRMAQDFSLRYPLVDGKGNFGSVDGDAAAAYRYTEARMSKIAVEMLADIEKNTVDFVPNYDDKLTEPAVLPSKVPGLLVNGSSGIAVGMATNIPPHNITEVINGAIAVMDDPYISLEELMTHIKGPDFPTAGIIMGKSGIRAAYGTGRGKITVRARADIEQTNGSHQQIIVTELPYQVNKARLIEKIAELVRDKRLDGISGLRDESDRDGMRIVIELKRDANANVVLNNLYKNTQLQESFGVIMLALVDNKPKVLTLREMLDNYIAFQKDIVKRRTKFDLDKALARANILEGLRIAIDHIDEIIKIIRNSPTIADSKQNLIERFGFNDLQAQAIVDMRLGRLSGLEREKIEEEYIHLTALIKEYREILSSESKVLEIIKEELIKLKDKYGDDRRTEIMAVENEIDIEDLIEEEDIIITLTHFGYAKRLSADTYKSQRRGGKGITGLTTREEDFVEHLFTTTTHHNIMFFTNKGVAYSLKGYEIPEAGRMAKGTAMVNLLQLDADETITAMIPIKEFEDDMYLTFVTKQGVIKKTPLMDYSNLRKSGLRAINLDDDDELINVELTDGERDIILGTHNGMAIRFNERDARPMGRVTHGVRGIRLKEGDYVVGASIVSDDAQLLVVTENGYGKKTEFDEYKVQSRGGMGVRTYKITSKTGKIAALKTVSDTDDLMMITSSGIIIRLSTRDISTIGRSTQGVRLMRMDDGVYVVGVAITKEKDEGDDDLPPSENQEEEINYEN